MGNASRIRPPGKGKPLVRQAYGAGIFHFRPVLILGAGQLRIGLYYVMKLMKGAGHLDKLHVASILTF